MKQIRTGHDIPFAPDKVWSVLADFDRYSEWNSLNVWARGEAELGARVPMRFVDAGAGNGKIVAQTVTVTGVERGRYLEWTGRIPVLFTGRHFFVLEPTAAGTRLVHGEDLSGLLPALFSQARIERQKRAYEALNIALETRVGELSAGWAVPRGGIEPPTP